jgi:hypothetical protein
MPNDSLAIDRFEDRIALALGKSFRENLPTEPDEMESVHGQTVIWPRYFIDSASTVLPSTTS